MKHIERSAHEARVIKNHAIAKANIERALIVNPDTREVMIEYSNKRAGEAYVNSLTALDLYIDSTNPQNGDYIFLDNAQTGADAGIVLTQTGVDKLAVARIDNPALNALMEGSQHTPRLKRRSAQPPRSF